MSRATKASKKDGEKAKEPDCVCDLCDGSLKDHGRGPPLWGQLWSTPAQILHWCIQVSLSGTEKQLFTVYVSYLHPATPQSRCPRPSKHHSCSQRWTQWASHHPAMFGQRQLNIPLGTLPPSLSPRHFFPSVWFWDYKCSNRSTTFPIMWSSNL